MEYSYHSHCFISFLPLPSQYYGGRGVHLWNTEVRNPKYFLEQPNSWTITFVFYLFLGLKIDSLDSINSITITAAFVEA